MTTVSKIHSAPLKEIDPELAHLLRQEEQWQKRGLEMRASENLTSRAVLECLGSRLHNTYSDSYYGDDECFNPFEKLAQKRALETYKLNPEEWGCNVKPYSGSPANFAVFTGVLNPHDRIMGQDVHNGGHFTHGYMTENKRASATSIFFESMPYNVDSKTGLIDYETLAKNAKLFKPKMIIAGVSCYSRCLDYARFRQICDSVNAYLLADMAHVAGIVAAEVIPSPFEYADIVTTTTHKTLNGPRGGVIFFRKGVRKVKPNGEKVMYDLEQRINDAVFPGLQSGPHVHTIGAIATGFLQAQTPEFRVYQKQIVLNAQRLSNGLQKCGCTVVTGGTDVHLILVDLRSIGLTGTTGRYVLEKVNITCDKNAVPGDESAMNPSGIRLGTAALTTRGLVESDIDQVVGLIHRALKISTEASKISGPKFIEFQETVHKNDAIKRNISELRRDVEQFSSQFSVPGPDDL